MVLLLQGLDASAFLGTLIGAVTFLATLEAWPVHDKDYGLTAGRDRVSVRPTVGAFFLSLRRV